MKKGHEGCNKNDCEYLHPKMCNKELKCLRTDCKFLHPSIRYKMKENTEDKKDEKSNKDEKDIESKDKKDDKINSEKVTSEETQ